METIRINAAAPDPDGVDRIARLLRQAKVLAFPTETYYGLGADARCETALGAVHEAKGRPRGSPLLLLLGSVDQIDDAAAERPDELPLLAEAFWPGPLTIVLRAREDLSQLLTAGTGTIGVRVSGLALARALPLALGGPITGTSANRSGEPPARTAAEARAALAGRIDGIVDGGDAPGGAPSTVVDLSTGAPRLVREGAVPFARILGILSRR